MKKPLLYPKLAWQGIRKNAEMYLPYLLMGILMVGVSYIMNYLTRPALMGALSMGGTTLMVLQASRSGRIQVSRAQHPEKRKRSPLRSKRRKLRL